MLILPTLIPPVLHQDNLYSLTFFLLKLHQQIKVHALRCLHLVRSLQDYNNTIQYNTIIQDPKKSVPQFKRSSFASARHSRASQSYDDLDRDTGTDHYAALNIPVSHNNLLKFKIFLRFKIFFGSSTYFLKFQIFF